MASFPVGELLDFLIACFLGDKSLAAQPLKGSPQQPEEDKIESKSVGPRT